MKIKHFLSSKFITALILILCGSFVSANNDFNNMLQQAKSVGSTNIIVKLKINSEVEGTLGSPTAVSAQRGSISGLQSNVLSQLSSVGKMENIKQYKTVPYLALQADKDVLLALKNHPAVESIELDQLARPTLLQSVPFINGDDVINRGNDGDGWAVAVLDTGVRKTHIDLDAGKVISEACYGTTFSGYSSSPLCPNGQESQIGSGAGVNCSTSISGCSHGTHVAGIAAGTYGGVAPAADIIAIQVFSRFDNAGICFPEAPPCVLTYTSDQMLALERVYELRNTHRIAAVNMSLGGGEEFSHCDSNSLKPIIDNLRAAGIATVIASGNNGFNGSIGSPACISSAIAVGSTLDSSNAVSSFSNHSNLLDVQAPGSNITSSVATTSTSRASYNGTSMATPHVAGAFAVLRDHKPDATVTEIERALESTGVGVTRSGITVPRIDILAARNSSILSPPSPNNSSIVPTLQLLLLE